MKWRGTSTDSSTLPDRVDSLYEQLSEIKANIAEYVKPEDRAINERAVALLRESGIAAKALQAGTDAPTFTLQDQNGKDVSSAEILAHHPLIVVFFRGRWCPFCVTTLKAWRDAQHGIATVGAKIVAISPQVVRHNNFTTDQYKISTPVLSDPGNQTAKAYGIAYRVPEEQQSLYRSVFINLPQVNGDDSWELPIPAVFVIAKDGTIKFASANEDYTVRTEPAEVLRKLSV
jgi:peroxiredoxin